MLPSPFARLFLATASPFLGERGSGLRGPRRCRNGETPLAEKGASRGCSRVRAPSSPCAGWRWHLSCFFLGQVPPRLSGCDSVVPCTTNSKTHLPVYPDVFLASPRLPGSPRYPGSRRTTKTDPG